MCAQVCSQGTRIGSRASASQRTASRWPPARGTRCSRFGTDARCLRLLPLSSVSAVASVSSTAALTHCPSIPTPTERPSRTRALGHSLSSHSHSSRRFRLSLSVRMGLSLSSSSPPLSSLLFLYSSPQVASRSRVRRRATAPLGPTRSCSSICRGRIVPLVCFDIQYTKPELFGFGCGCVGIVLRAAFD